MSSSASPFDQDGDGVPLSADCDDTDPSKGSRYLDADNDGYGAGSPLAGCNAAEGEGYSDRGGDCDDSALTSSPAVPEVCDGADNDCDGAVDEGLDDEAPVDAPRWYRDQDKDHYGVTSVFVDSCYPPAGYAAADQDCNDLDPKVNPAMPELCDGIDNNCGGAIDEYFDQDGDDFTSCDGDCNDLAVETNPDADEVCDGTDNDCDEEIDEGFDKDGDGFSSCDGDCDDQTDLKNSGEAEICDGVDNNCDHVVDEGVQTLLYRDQDGDGFGSATEVTWACEGSVSGGYVANDDDCLDTNASAYPGADEIPGDTLDESCDGTENCYQDKDNDGYRTGETTSSSDLTCSGEGMALAAEPAGDCDDDEPQVNPGKLEVVDELDNDCDDIVDDGVLDKDQDGFTVNEGDCDDSSKQDYPDADEYCDDVDNDCDGKVDEGVSQLYFEDRDEDGFGNENVFVYDCMMPPGYSVARGDCNDVDSTVYPGALDRLGDGVDSDCGGVGKDGPQPSVGLSGSTYGSVGEAVSHAVENDIVWIGPGIWPVKDLTYGSSNFAIRSTNMPILTVLRTEQSGVVVTIAGGQSSASILDGFTLTGGRSSQGGGLYIANSSPIIRDCIVSGNDARSGSGGGAWIIDSPPEMPVVFERTVIEGNFALGGGALRVLSSNVLLRQCMIRRNSAWDGGGIYIGREDSHIPSTVILTDDSEVSENSATEYGGGLAITDDSQVTIVKSNISRNVSTNGAGIFILGNSELLLDGTVIKENIASTVGGGLHASSPSTIRIGDSAFSFNFSYNGAGAQVDSGVTFNVQDTEFSNNSASGSGGGILLYASGSLDGVTFKNNQAGNAGGLYILGDSKASLTSCSFIGNSSSAGGNGGGLAVDDSSVTVDSCQFLNNTTGGSGGGALFTNNATATMSNDQFIGNSASVTAGGLVAGAGSEITLTRCRFSENSSNSVGAVFVADSTLTASDSQFVGNTSATNAGAISLWNTEATLDHCNITDNQATGPFVESELGAITSGAAGGMVAGRGSASSKKLTMSNCHFARNQASFAGGLWLYGIGATLTNCLLEENSANGEGPGHAGHAGAMSLQTGASASLVNCVLANNAGATGGGGVVLEGSSEALSLTNAILAYNQGGNFWVYSGNTVAPTINIADFYNPTGFGADKPSTPKGVLTDPPGFLAFDADNLPIDFHLSLDSKLVDVGYANIFDPDGSRSDLGIYGGPAGDEWDRDHDGFFDYFWPGDVDDAPDGFTPWSYDCDDLDPETGLCLPPDGSGK